MSRTLLLAAALAVLAATTIPAPAGASPSTAPRKTLTAFASEQELADLFKRWAEEAERRRKEEVRRRDFAASQGMLAQSPAPASAAPAKAAEAMADSVTNVQHAGVDEGGIVKVHGEHLVVLRRGRLFTVRIAGGALEPVSSADAFGPDIDPRGAWYDEMLISGNTIVVIGYSYARGGTEIGLFEIARAGRLAHKGHLPPALERLLLVAQLREPADRHQAHLLLAALPQPVGRRSVRRSSRRCAAGSPGATPADFKRIAPATRIYRTDEELDPYAGVALHTVTVVRSRETRARVREHAVMGPPGRVFYVSPSSVFVWTTQWRRGAAAARRLGACSASRSTARRRAR